MHWIQQLFKCVLWAASLFLPCLAVGLPSGRAARIVTDTIPDKTITDTLFSNSQEELVDVWFRKMPKQVNVAGLSSIDGEVLRSHPVADLSNALSGRLPGLFTRQNSGRAGSNFDKAAMTLRGRTPIVVVDGIIRDFTAINFNDIDQVTVMKDALSTSMFGNRSANGVVYITTKDQSKHRPFEASFDAQWGFLEDLKRFNFVDAYTYASLYNEAQLNSNPRATPAFSNSALEAYRNGTNDPFFQPYAEYYGAIYQPSSAQSRYNVNFSGRGETFNYFLSGEYFGQGGNLVDNPDKVYNTSNPYDRYNLRGNGRISFSKMLSVGFHIFAGFETYNEPGGTLATSINRAFFQPRTIHPIYNPDNTFSGTPAWTRNAVGSALSSGYITGSVRRINTDIDLHFNLEDITDGLWAKAVASISNFYNRSINRVVNPPTFGISRNANGEIVYSPILAPGFVTANIGVPSITDQFNRNYFSGLLGYDKSWNGHKIRSMATYYYDLYNDSYTQLANVNHTFGLSANYSFRDRYIAELGLSYASVNRYPEENRWILLPAVGLGWIASNESWFPSENNTLSLLKLRGSVGKNATSVNSGYFAHIQGYTLNTTGYNFGASSTNVSGTTENFLANPSINYERALKYDMGIEFGLFKNTLQLTAEYYNNHFYDEVISPFNNLYSGIIGQTLREQNLGQTRYYGWELSMQHRRETSGGFGYHVGGNFNIAKSRIIDRNEGYYPYEWGYSEGGYQTQIFGYESLGLVESAAQASSLPTIAGYSLQPGDIYYRDLNGDGVINQYDQKVIAGDKPTIFYGLNFGFHYKGLDLSVLFQGAKNTPMMLNPLEMSAFVNGAGYVLDYTTENRWTPTNMEDAALPRLSLGPNINNTQNSSFWLRDASYLRLKNMEVGYSLPHAFLQRIRLQSLRLFVNGQNLMTWTPLDYFDPESGMGYSPNKRIINAGVTIGL